MPSDTSHHRPRPSRPPHLTLPAPPLDHPPSPLPCPRCQSNNTKFCYYNNYNLAQPRHFCKACRRYWTHGGALRDVPVGGGTRKTTKRSRSTKTTSSYEPISINPISSLSMPVPGPGSASSSMMAVGSAGVGLGLGGGGFTSLLNSHGNGFLALNGFGLGIGSGYDDMGGFDIGKGAWPLCLPDIGEGTDSSGGVGGGGGGVEGDTWQLGVGGDGGFGDSECLSWPELAMSTPRKGVK